MIHPSCQGKGLAKKLISTIKEYAIIKLNATYFIARINVKNMPSIYTFLKQDGAFVGRAEVGNFPDGSRVLGLNIFFPANYETTRDNCVFIKSIFVDRINFPIQSQESYEIFCKLIKSGYIISLKNNIPEICRPFIRNKQQVLQCSR